MKNSPSAYTKRTGAVRSQGAYHDHPEPRRLAAAHADGGRDRRRRRARPRPFGTGRRAGQSLLLCAVLQSVLLCLLFRLLSLLLWLSFLRLSVLRLRPGRHQSRFRLRRPPSLSPRRPFPRRPPPLEAAPRIRSISASGSAGG